MPPLHPQIHAPLALPPQLPQLQHNGNWIFGSQPFYPHQPLFTIPYNSYQQLSHISLQPSTSNLYISFTLPSMKEFLREVDEKEETGQYYQDFLEKFKMQRVLVKHLSELIDEEFEKCGIDTVGARKTLREYARRYQQEN
ncbi:28532_t:CDS:1 [Dentiscutata erythropus]|uniref:28532_t:CDS:1 n=1 Tax=Dentiscutata erythropus TaxID=1348616 RepID=A0A9N9E098_9GLOM|nr:28532_t:CDS:1 [Dentiscutata erythropus]